MSGKKNLFSEQRECQKRSSHSEETKSTDIVYETSSQELRKDETKDRTKRLLKNKKLRLSNFAKEKQKKFREFF